MSKVLKVLIAEDNFILADILEDYLVSQGYDVCGIASTVDQAVNLADLHKPDLAVLDFRLADGEYGSQIRARLKDKSMIGILYASGDPLNKLTTEHGEAYIKKPYGLNDIVRGLRIIREIKISGTSNRSAFPTSFHLLKKPDEGNRKAA
jgi:two-component system, response regulator PdtaR